MKDNLEYVLMIHSDGEMEYAIQPDCWMPEYEDESTFSTQLFDTNNLWDTNGFKDLA